MNNFDAETLGQYSIANEKSLGHIEMQERPISTKINIGEGEYDQDAEVKKDDYEEDVDVRKSPDRRAEKPKDDYEDEV